MADYVRAAWARADRLRARIRDAQPGEYREHLIRGASLSWYGDGEYEPVDEPVPSGGDETQGNHPLSLDADRSEPV